MPQSNVVSRWMFVYKYAPEDALRSVLFREYLPLLYKYLSSTSLPAPAPEFSSCVNSDTQWSTPPLDTLPSSCSAQHTAGFAPRCLSLAAYTCLAAGRPSAAVFSTASAAVDMLPCACLYTDGTRSLFMRWLQYACT